MRIARLGLTAAAIVATALALTDANPAPAQALSGSDWDPGSIVSDAQFYDYNAMTVPQIQAFLESRVTRCETEKSAGPNDPIVCLKDYTMTTATIPADQYCPATYEGAANEKASTIIFKVAQACRVSPKALLVTLQKENGLVTHTWPSAWRYRTAMGYGCPDTAPCEEQYFGFQNQLWQAARQFQRYRATPTRWAYTAGYAARVPVNIYFHPNSACGSSAVLIKNQATAGLYNYTPYQPNSAALTNLNGTGNSCSSYGNRNFWRYWWSWFGDPRSEQSNTGWAVLGSVTETRIVGQTRYDTAVSVSKLSAPGVPVVYLASGQSFPDALASAPAAAMQNGPLLLTTTQELPAAVAAELDRLNPERIVVVGGTSAISDAVLAAATPYAGAKGIARVAGSDRFATSRAIAADAWAGKESPTVYIATGTSFPDALSAASVAGTKDAPVLIVDGRSTTVDQATLDAVTRLKPTRVVLAGGTDVLNGALDAALAKIPGVTSVDRLEGETRYETNASLIVDAFGPSPSVFVASGENYPDALAGAARAGQEGVPLYLVPGQCLPTTTANTMKAGGVTSLKVVGGVTAVSQSMVFTSLCE